MRQFSFLDRILVQANDALATIFAASFQVRENPAEKIAEGQLTHAQRQKSAGFMRVNHTGEVCAQALYRGQLMVSHSDKTRAMLKKSCEEETDHLIWTRQRLLELNSNTSYLNIFFYFHSFLIGMIAGLAGDRWSLGFVEETEIQVAKHLQTHLEKLPAQDFKSRAIVSRMRDEEMQHEQAAVRAGATDMPVIIKKCMQWHAMLMTSVTYWV